VRRRAPRLHELREGAEHVQRAVGGGKVADTVERILPAEVSKAAAALAVMTYVVAEMPERLPK
jgi:hypothetical protein